MSIESFTESYPADASFVGDISRRPEFGNSSPVGLMADIYYKEGSRGLYGSVDRVSKALSLQDLELAQHLNDKFVTNSFAVLLGVSVRSIEKIIVDGEFDQFDFNARLESAFTGSGVKPILIENPKIEVIDPRRIHDIREVAIKDKTFGDFFAQGYRNLPRSLAHHMEESEFSDFANDILPGFIQRVSLLLAEKDHNC